MLKRINWKAIGKGFAWAVCLSGVIVLMSFISMKKQEVKCTNVKILIPGADNFIEREEIDAILRQSQGNLVGRKLEDINTHEIEKAMQANPYIAFAKVYADMDGVIEIQIKQRQPVLRIINAGGQDFYIDRDGLKMPMSQNFTANVLVATGNIYEGFGGRIDTLITPLVVDLYKAALFLKKDTLWDSQIEQIFVDNKGDIELIPRVGNQRIILGNADSLSVKMGNLLAFYKQAMPQVGWNAYKTINVKYINQIVCEKNTSDSLATKKPIIPSNINPIELNDSTIKTEVNNEVKKEPEKLPSVVSPKNESKSATKDVKKTVAKETNKVNVVKEDKTSTAKEKTPVKSNPALYTPPAKPAVDKTKSKEAISEKTTGVKEKTPVKNEAALYKPPAKTTVEKVKSTVATKEKTDTKKPK